MSFLFLPISHRAKLAYPAGGVSRPAQCDVYREERIRERDHGLDLLDKDSSSYSLMHREQDELYK